MWYTRFLPTWSLIVSNLSYLTRESSAHPIRFGSSTDAHVEHPLQYKNAPVPQPPEILPGNPAVRVLPTKRVMTTIPRNSPSKTLKQKHPLYYLSDGNAVVQAGNVLFRFDLLVLHAKSLVLQSILPNTQPSRLPKFDDAHPLQLLETSATDLERLLQVLLPLPNSPLHSLSTPEHYLSLLNIASKYHIPTIISLATSRLHNLPSPGLDPIRKIAIWDQYKLDSHLLRSSYVTLCQREQPLSLQMGLTLGVNRLTALAAARQTYREKIGCKGCGKRKGMSKKDKAKIAEQVVDKLFFKKEANTASKPGSRPVLSKVQLAGTAA